MTEHIHNCCNSRMQFTDRLMLNGVGGVSNSLEENIQGFFSPSGENFTKQDNSVAIDVNPLVAVDAQAWS
jgi:hypothetical protein